MTKPRTFCASTATGGRSLPCPTAPIRSPSATRRTVAYWRRWSLRDGVSTLLFVGQMDFKKNPHLILRACALLRDQGEDFQLVMAGAGQDLERLKALAASLNLQDRVLFTGFVGDREEILSLYRRADLLVFPSVYDNAPMVVREAAAMGTPALLVRGSCSAEGVTHGDNGFLCEADPASIASGIMEALPRAARRRRARPRHHSHPMGLADGTSIGSVTGA